MVGLGMMGQHHARVYSELGCELVGVVDANIERAQELAQKYNTRCYSDYKELIPQVDAVTIAVPTTLHHKVALDFINHGVHCLVEKPIASTLQEAEQIVQQAEANSVRLMVGHIERFNPAVTQLKQRIDEGVLGKLMIISTRRVGPFVTRIRDVGIIIDTTTHDIDIARYLTGKEPLSIFCKAGRFKHQKEDHAIVVLDFGDMTACLEANWFTPYKVRSLVATGSEGIASLDYITQELSIHNSSQSAAETDITPGEPLKLELGHFLHCVECDEQPLVSGYDGLRALDIALRAEEASTHV